jgi:hypothetical protein
MVAQDLEFDLLLDYVLQRALQIAEEPKPLEGLVMALRPQLLAMRRHSSTSPFTKHISSSTYMSPPHHDPR